MAEMLPVTDPDLVTQLQSEYTLAFQAGSQKEVVSARYRCASEDLLLLAQKETTPSCIWLPELQGLLSQLNGQRTG